MRWHFTNHGCFTAITIIYFSVTVGGRAAAQNLEDRLFRPLPGRSLFSKLYNRFWAIDSTRLSLTNHAPSWLALPVVTYSPETKINFKAVALYSFYNSSEAGQRNSSIYATGNYSANGRYSIALLPTIWTASNRYYLAGSASYQNELLLYYGTGDRTQLASETGQQTRQLKFSLDAERLVAPHVYAGLVAQFQYASLSFTPSPTRSAGFSQDTSSTGKTGGHLGTAGINGVFDNRNNQNYTSKGSFAKLVLSTSVTGVSSSTIRQLSLDLRHFVALGGKHTLALQGLVLAQTGDVPFYFQNQLGNDHIMRGYYQGRYRDRNILAGQAEYRYLFFRRFGAVAFAGAGNARPSVSFNGLKPNFGIGGRYVFDLPSRLTVRIDYGVGEKPSGEKRNSGLYLALGEAF